MSPESLRDFFNDIWTTESVDLKLILRGADASATVASGNAKKRTVANTRTIRRQLYRLGRTSVNLKGRLDDLGGPIYDLLDSERKHRR